MALCAQTLDHLVGELDVGRALRPPHRFEIVHAAQQHGALEQIDRHVVLAPVGGEHARAELRSRGVRTQIDASRVPAEACGVAVDPEQRATHLLRHGKQATARFLHVDEIWNDAMGAGANEHLRLDRIVRRLVAPPRAAMDEDVDRRVRPCGSEDIQRLDRRLPVCDMLRIAQDLTCPFAVGELPLDDLLPVGGVDLLVIGIVKCLLVHVEPHQWALCARRGLSIDGLRCHVVSDYPRCCLKKSTDSASARSASGLL